MIVREIKLLNPNHPSLKAHSEDMKRGMKVVHVIPHKKGWAVKRTLSNTPKFFKRKMDAVAFASQLAFKSKSNYITYLKSGDFQSRVTPKK